jgi:hypothetical protein
MIFHFKRNIHSMNKTGHDFASFLLKIPIFAPANISRALFKK